MELTQPAGLFGSLTRRAMGAALRQRWRLAWERQVQNLFPAHHTFLRIVGSLYGGAHVVSTATARRGRRPPPAAACTAYPARSPPRFVEFITGPTGGQPGPAEQATCGRDPRTALRGDYRVLVGIDDASRTVLIVRIEHCADAYRRR